jgi:hypothetical protein
MKVTLAEAIEVKRRAEDRLLAIPGVHMVGFGPKVSSGEPTNEFAILVYVLEKRPKSSLPNDEVIPDEIEGVKTDVLQTEPPKPHSLEGGDEIYVEQLLSGEVHRDTGTLGCFAWRQDTNPPKSVLLSNDHVLYGSQPATRGQNGDPVKVSSCSGCCDKTIAKLLRTSGPNDPQIDAAIAELEAGVKWLPRVNGIPVVGTLDFRLSSLPALPAPVQAVLASKKLIVKKLGCKTGYKIGVIGDVDGRSLTRTGQIQIWPVYSDAFSDHGDSGSAIYVDNSTDNAANVVQAIFGAPPAKSPDKVKVIGLLWGGGPETINGKQVHVTSACHIEPVTTALNIKIATNSPEVVYEVAAEPRPHPALERVYNDLSGAEYAKQIVNLYGKYADEITNLLRYNRRFVVAWHRNHGPQMVRSLIDVAENRRPFLPEEIEGQSWADSMEQVACVLLEIGSPGLRADVMRYRSLATRLGGKSYEELLGFLVISDAFTPTIESGARIALNQ